MRLFDVLRSLKRCLGNLGGRRGENRKGGLVGIDKTDTEKVRMDAKTDNKAKMADIGYW